MSGYRRKAVASLAVGAALITSLFAVNSPATAKPPTSAAETVEMVQTRSEPGHFMADGVNIRRNPSPNSVILGKGYEGERVTIHCNARDSAGYHWYKLTARRGNVTGYSRQDFVYNDGGVTTPCR